MGLSPRGPGAGGAQSGCQCLSALLCCSHAADMGLLHLAVNQDGPEFSVTRAAPNSGSAEQTQWNLP